MPTPAQRHDGGATRASRLARMAVSASPTRLSEIPTFPGIPRFVCPAVGRLAWQHRRSLGNAGRSRRSCRRDGHRSRAEHGTTDRSARAAVGSAAKISSRRPPIPFPSVKLLNWVMSPSRWSEALRLDEVRVVAGPDEQIGDMLDEGRRPAHERPRSRAGRGRASRTMSASTRRDQLAQPDSGSRVKV